MDPIYDFSGRDYTARLEALQTLQGQEVPEYTDLNYADPGQSLTRQVAREGDQLGFYQDNDFFEGFIWTALFKQSLIDLGLLVGYLPILTSAASTRMRFTRKDGVTGAITVPQFTVFGRSDGLEYLTLEQIVMAAEENTAETNVLQGRLVTRQFAPEEVTISDWSGHPRVALETNVAAGTVEVQHGTDPIVAWTEIDSFWRSLSSDAHFLLELNGDDDSSWLVFGDGVKGQLPPAQETVNVRYIRTDAAAGNCGAGVITIVPSELTASITATNIEPATGGGPAETREHIRSGIPAMVRTQRRGVTPEDYETLIGHMAGVLHVQCVDRGTHSDQWPHLHVVLYVVPNGGGPMSSQLKDEIWAELADWGHLGEWKKRYILLDATEAAVNVSVNIGILPGYTQQTVVNAATAAIQNVLAPENQEIGGTLDFNDLFRAANGVAGVSYADFVTPTDDVTRGVGEINVAGTIVVNPQ